MRVIKFIKNNSKIFQIIISFLIITYLLKDVDQLLIFNIIKTIDPIKFFYTLIILFISLLLYPYKWWVILRFLGMKLSFGLIYNLNLVASFYNMVLPTRLGGDFLKYFILTKNNDTNGEKIAASILIDRIFNLIAIAIIFIVSTINTSYNYYSIYFWIISIFGTSLVLVKITPKILNFKNIRRFKLIKSMFISFDYLNIFFNSFKKSIFIILTSFVNVMVTFFMSYSIGLAIGIEISFSYYLYFMSLTSIVTIIPISLGGFGIREGIYIHFLGILNVSKELALSLSIVSYLLMLLPSFFGYLISIVFNIKYSSK